MPTFIRGNLQEISQQLFIENDDHEMNPLGGAFVEVDYSSNQKQIQKDLHRSHFVPTNGQKVDRFITDWVNNPRNDFMQGNMTASLFEMALQVHILEGKNFTKEGRSEEDRMDYFLARKSINLAYYNDQGEPCGVSFSYSKEDPSLWTVSVIRNTTAAPEERDICVLGASEVFGKGKDVSATDCMQEFSAMLGSKEMAKIFADTITPDGHANFEALDALDKKSKDEYIVKESHPLLARIKKRFSELAEQHADITTEHLQQKNAEAIAEKTEAYVAYKNETLPQRTPLEERLKKLQQSPLDQGCSQSFLQRNWLECTMGAIGTLALTGLVLSVIPPVGIAITAMAAVAAVAVAAVAAIAVIALSIASIFSKEQSHQQHHSEKSEAEEALTRFDADYQEQCQTFEQELVSFRYRRVN